LAQITLSNQAQQTDDKYLAWKTLGGFLVTFAITWLAAAAWGVGTRFIGLQLNLPQAISSTVSRLGHLAIIVGAFGLATRIVLKRSLFDFALRLHRGWWADLLFGAALSTLAMFTLYVIYVGGGWLIVEGWRWQTMALGAWLAVLWGSILSCALAAVGEEIVFRGYLLTGLKEVWGRWVGLIVTAVIFAGIHLPVSGAEKTPVPLFILALMGPGLLLGWAYLRTGSLWLAIGIHFTWNLVQGELLNLPANTSNPNIFGAQTQLQGPAWLVGTEYGVEVGVLSLVVLGIVFAGVWLWTRHRQPIE
jgi:membrane protease YdiL (CAAX protease family)